MKKLNRRMLFPLALIVLLIAGMVLLLGRYAVNGAKWAGFSANQHVYSDGVISTGGIYDRNGVLLYDGKTHSYNDDWLTRVSTLHVVGDEAGMINTSALEEFGGRLSGFNLLTGTSTGGNNLYLTIDSQLNAVAYEALDGYKGTVGVYNYKTGEIVCLVSAPAYDPANVPAISDGDPAYEGVYLNRFYSSSYTPGSTFKIITLAAALENLGDLSQRTFTCDGATPVGGDVVTCPSAHGTMDITSAFAHSCNGVFGSLAVELGAATLNSYADQAGLTQRHAVSGISTAAGSFTQAEQDIDLAWSGVGQYQDLANPEAMLRLMGAIANDGIPVEPRLLHAQRSQTLGLPTAFFSAHQGDRIWSASTCDTLAAMMRNNVIETYGQDRFGDLAVCAKSGTAEVGDVSPHSWFVGFIDDPQNPYAFVVVVENSGSGSSVAGTVAATVLRSLTGE